MHVRPGSPYESTRMALESVLHANRRLQFREAAFRLRLRQLTSDDGGPHGIVAVNRFIAFALSCVWETPLPGSCTPGSLLKQAGALRGGLCMVESWLNDPSAAPKLRGLLGRSFREADEAGAFAQRPEELIGFRAANLAAFQLHLGATLASSKDVSEKPGAALEAIRWATFLACRSAEEGLTPTALEFQERLFENHFGNQASSGIGTGL
jgi:hypothetical protein